MFLDPLRGAMISRFISKNYQGDHQEKAYPLTMRNHRGDSAPMERSVPYESHWRKIRSKPRRQEDKKR